MNARICNGWIRYGALAAVAGIVMGGAVAGDGFFSAERAQMRNNVSSLAEAWDVLPLITVGEESESGEDVNENVFGYRPVGILDGLAAFAHEKNTVRVIANHELSAEQGYPYELANGTMLTGARLSYFDINRETLGVDAAGPAYDTIIDRFGNIVTDPAQIHEGNNVAELDGCDRFCSSYGIVSGDFGFADNIYFCGEEVAEFGAEEEDGLGGQEFALDVDAGVLYGAPMLGRASFENVAPVENFGTDKVVLLIGDDREAAPLYLYIGQIGAAPAEGYDPPEFLTDNGLGYGHLFVWVADNGDRTPEDFNGTFESRTGEFVRIEHFEPDMAGESDYDEMGFASLGLQDARSLAAGGFQFSRPEDLGTNPEDATQIVFASTGRGSLFPSDNWGTTYIIDFDAAELKEALNQELGDINNVPAELVIIYDGDDAGAGQFIDPDWGLRSPDNLDWADDGFVYVQEDRSTSPGSLFGAVSGMEASMWQLNPASGRLVRILEIDRSAVPRGQFDAAPDDLGNWESSGVLDVSELFPVRAGETLLILDTQAHSLGSEKGRGLSRKAEQGEDLVQGGQLMFASNRSPFPSRR